MQGAYLSQGKIVEKLKKLLVTSLQHPNVIKNPWLNERSFCFLCYVFQEKNNYSKALEIPTELQVIINKVSTPQLDKPTVTEGT